MSKLYVVFMKEITEAWCMAHRAESEQAWMNVCRIIDSFHTIASEMLGDELSPEQLDEYSEFLDDTMILWQIALNRY